ncbi:hypothetical protein [Actomonas aquatica]|uniref:Dicarboxylate transport domain-containing protein n=1 Tax=Actomonas aquatica TaxID=2866162 RepID=A0ABZ1CDK1_9BACT|nr:hypothetical protein [Opitutus sp. WL0086]WRQ89492.1 hypothetical protein K1X11_008725 [Opitutus sp. WL0086]
MSRLFCFLLLFVGGTGIGAQAENTTAAHPPALRISGAWAGELRADERLPAIPWNVALETTLGETLRLQFTADTPAGEVRVEVWQEAGDAGAYRWRLPEQRLAVAAVRTWLLPLLPAELSELDLAGDVVVAGEGTYSAEAEGGADGRLSVSWQSPTAAWSAQNVRLEEVQVAATLQLADSALRDAAVTLAWARAEIMDTPVGPGSLRAEQEQGQGGAWRVSDARIALWQGEVALDPFTIDPAAPRLSTEVVVQAVAIDELAPYFPEAVRAANGRMSGRFAINWSLAQGLAFGRGALQVLSTEVAQVKLASSPGLLSGRMPAKIAVLPSWLGPLAEWTAAENPAKAELEEIEQGRRFIQVERLEVQLYPDGVDGSTSARVRLVGRPENSAVVDKVDFTVNVSGPLQELIELGLDDRASISAGSR